MEEKLLSIIRHYKLKPQLKHMVGEVYELIEAILILDREHIYEEYADVQVMLQQIKALYHLDDSIINEIMELKVDRQLRRIADELEKRE